MHGEFTIGEFVVRPQMGTISKLGRTIRVEPKVMDLLLYLAGNAGEVVGKEHIVRNVWQGVFVTDEVLTNAIWKLRRIFEDNAGKPRFIETIPKRGYRFVASISLSENHWHVATTKRPIVGHEEERGEFRECFVSAVGGHGHLICVSGEAGIGKTTLVEEFLSEGRLRDCFIGRGKCSQRLVGTGAYMPILEALESLTHAAADVDLARLMRRVAPGWHVQVFPHADDSMALSASTAGMSTERMKRELTAYLHEVSDIRPLLLFFDDMHWADESSVDMLAYLCERCPSARMLILAAFRPECLFPAEHAFLNVKRELQAHGVCREIKLGQLSREDVSCYIEKAFAGHCLPPGFAESIYGWTEGNPLFMVDLLAYFREHRIIVQDAASGKWRLVRPFSGTECPVPDSVHDLIELKIHKLGEDNRRLLECACVQGHDFDSAVISRALGADQANVEEHLDRLDRLYGFVRRVGCVKSARPIPASQYQFVHVLYTNALHESLGQTRMASLSRAVAGAVLEIHGDHSGALASQLAYLFEVAGDYGRSAKYFLAAAQRATGVSADREAVTLARRGLNLLDGVTDAKERDQLELFLRMALGFALRRLRGYSDPEVGEAYRRAHKLCQHAEDDTQLCQILLGLATYSLTRSDLKAALEIGERGLRLADSSQNPVHLAGFSLITSSALSHMGKLFAALEHAERGLPAYDPQDYRTMLSFGGFDAALLCHTARIRWLCGYPEQARSKTSEALALARRLNHPYPLALVHYMASWIHSYLGDSLSCLQEAEKAIAISSEHGFLLIQNLSKALRGWAIVTQGQLREGIEEMERGLEHLRTIGCRLTGTEFLCLQAAARIQAGEVTGAMVLLDRALALMEEIGERYYEAEVYRTKAEILMRQSSESSHAEGELWLRRSLAVAREQKSKSFELRAATTLSRLHLEKGQRKDAFHELSSVYDWFTEGFDTPDLRGAREILNICREERESMMRA